MNFETIKLGFQQYLLDLNETSNKNYATTDSNSSIFLYAQEFKGYISDKLDVDPSILSMSVSDILKMDIVDGKLVDPNAQDSITSSLTVGDSYTGSDTDTTLDVSAVMLDGNGQLISEDEQTDILSNILNELLQTDEFINVIDTDKNSTLSDEEILAFLSSIKGFDENADDISLEDILGAVEAIQDGSFTITEETLSLEPETAVEETPSVSAPSSSSPLGSGGGTPISSTAANRTDSYESKSLSELNTLKQDQESIISQSTENIQSLYTQKNSDLEEYKSQFDQDLKANTEYNDQIKEKIQNYTDGIYEAKTTINDKKSQISAKDSEITSLQSQSDALGSDIAALTSALNSLDSSDENYQSQYNEIQSQITTKQGQKDEIDRQLEAAKTEKNNLEGELTTATDNLTNLENTKDNLKSEIGDEAFSIITNYESKISEIEKSYDSQISAEQKKIDSAKTELEKIDAAINTKNTREINKKYSNNSLGEDIIDTARQYVGYNEGDGSYLKFNQSGPWCAAYVTYVMAENGIDTGGTHSVAGLRSWGSQNGAYITKGEANTSNVKPGDIVIWEGDVYASHTGIVTAVYEDGSYDTIEGNSSDAVRENHYSSLSQASGFVSIG